MLTTLLLLGLSVFGNPPEPAFGTYIFTIPVRIENMTYITSAMVSCSVVRDDPSLPTPVSMGDPSTGSTTVPVSGGSFNGNITVSVAVYPDRIARYGAPTGWGCGISYRWRNPDGTMYTDSPRPGEREGIYTRLTGQAISEATVSVRGTLPP